MVGAWQGERYHDAMCGRYVLQTEFKVLAALYGLTGGTNGQDIDESIQPFLPRFNIAPSQQIPIIRERNDHGRELAKVKWGFVPHWAKEPTHVGTAPPPINARSEGVETKPTFREAIKKRRCLVPADGFYEWKKLDADGKRKQPMFITMADHSNFAMAGLWERWGSAQESAGVLETGAILTCAANEMMSQFHNRMPVILPREHWAEWLDPSRPISDVLALLQPLAAELMLAVPVSTRVNSPKNDDATLLQPLDPCAPTEPTNVRSSGRSGRSAAQDQGGSLWD